MPFTPELTTVTDVETYGGITASTATDALILQLIQRAERMIASICSRRDDAATSEAGPFFLTGTRVENFQTAYPESIVLTFTPVASVTTVKTFVASAQSTTAASATYRVDSDKATLRFSQIGLGAWMAGFPVTTTYGIRSLLPIQTNQAYPYTEITYVGGWASQAATPADLQQAAIDCTLWLYRRRRRDIGMASETLDNYSYSRFSFLEMQEYLRQMLTPYLRGFGL